MFFSLEFLVFFFKTGNFSGFYAKDLNFPLFHKSLYGIASKLEIVLVALLGLVEVKCFISCSHSWIDHCLLMSKEWEIQITSAKSKKILVLKKIKINFWVLSIQRWKECQKINFNEATFWKLRNWFCFY